MTENELKAQSENASRQKLMAEAVETYTEPHFIDSYKSTVTAAKILRAATATVSGLSATAFFGGLVYFNLPTYIGGGFAVAVSVAVGIGAAAAIEYMKATQSKTVFRGFFAKGSGIVPKFIFGSAVAGSIATSLIGSETATDITKKEPPKYEKRYTAEKAEAQKRYDKLEYSYLYANKIRNQDKAFLQSELAKVSKFDSLEAESEKEFHATATATATTATKYTNLLFWVVAVCELVYILCNLFIYWFLAKTKLLVSLQDGETTATNPPPTQNTATATNPPPPNTQTPHAAPPTPTNLDIINGTNINKLKMLYSTYRHNYRNAQSETAKNKNAQKMALIEKRLQDLGENIPEDKTPPPPPTRQIGFN